MSDLRSRLAAAERDLVELALHGPIEREWLPASTGILLPGKRHLLSAPAKSGKSLAMLAHAVQMVVAGATVAILDRENGADEYSKRLRDIVTSRDDEAATWEALDARRMRYFEYPTLPLSDGPALADLLGDRSLVIFDSSRMFLTSLGLGEDHSDDYAEFMAGLIDPLAAAGVATMILDNEGHQRAGARGTSAKNDLNEVIFTLKATSKPSPKRRGRLLLTCKDSRFGQSGDSWELELGGGTFGAWEPTAADGAAASPRSRARQAIRPTGQMQRISRWVEDHPGIPKSGVHAAISGRREIKDLALNLLVEGRYVATDPHGRGIALRSLRPYREADDLGPTSATPESPHLGPTSATPAESPNGALDTGESAHLGTGGAEISEPGPAEREAERRRNGYGTHA
jgi:hypothetical protein